MTVDHPWAWQHGNLLPHNVSHALVIVQDGQRPTAVLLLGYHKSLEKKSRSPLKLISPHVANPVTEIFPSVVIVLSCKYLRIYRRSKFRRLLIVNTYITISCEWEQAFFFQPCSKIKPLSLSQERIWVFAL